MVFHLRIGPLKLDSLLFLAFIVWSQLENIRICWTIYFAKEVRAVAFGVCTFFIYK